MAPHEEGNVAIELCIDKHWTRVDKTVYGKAREGPPRGRPRLYPRDHHEQSYPIVPQTSISIQGMSICGDRILNVIKYL